MPHQHWLRIVTGDAPTDAARVSGAACRSRAGLLAEWAARLRFPEYFGHNWDALADSLKDLTAAAPLTLVVDDAAQVLADEPPAQLRTLLAVLAEVAEAQPGTLDVILACGPGDEPELRERIAAAGAGR
ncbi:barstar family protein [Planosporangium mesophilum]|nr:barstar family protein [Planosporangium mesophilum]NJC85088.1 barstar family protein [Planosporangium mesophilum]